MNGIDESASPPDDDTLEYWLRAEGVARYDALNAIRTEGQRKWCSRLRRHHSKRP